MDEESQPHPYRRASDARATAGQGQGGDTKTVEEWRQLKRTSAIAFAAAQGLMGWVVGAEVSEGDYDQAIDDAMNVRIG